MVFLSLLFNWILSSFWKTKFNNSFVEFIFLLLSLLVASAIIINDSEKINWIAVLMWKFSSSLNYHLALVMFVFIYWVSFFFVFFFSIIFLFFFFIIYIFFFESVFISSCYAVELFYSGSFIRRRAKSSKTMLSSSSA